MTKQHLLRDKIHSFSLGARIVWVFVFTALLSSFLFGGAFKLLTADSENHVLPKIVADYGYSLVKEMGEPAELSKAKAIAKRTGIAIFIQSPLKNVSTNGKPLLDGIFDGHDYLEIPYQGLAFKIKLWHGKAFMQVTKPTEQITFIASFRHSSLQIGFVFTLFIILMSLVIYIAYRLVRYLIAPIQDIKHGVAKFAQGDLGYRINKKRNDDLGELTEQVNQMAGQLNSILEAKRQLLLAISHELRTPMTRMKIALDLPFNDKNKTRFNDSLKQMEKLLAELLESEKLSGAHQILSFQTESVNELITTLIDEEYSNSQLQLNLTTSNIDATIDVMRIRLLLRNLIGNAIKYGLDKPITVATTVNEKQIEITVEDQGEGIAEHSIDQVFEPFYREDQARQRQTGGTGMGLYLVKLIAEAHGGSVKIESKKGQGCKVTVLLKQAILPTRM